MCFGSRQKTTTGQPSAILKLTDRTTSATLYRAVVAMSMELHAGVDTSVSGARNDGFHGKWTRSANALSLGRQADL